MQKPLIKIKHYLFSCTCFLTLFSNTVNLYLQTVPRHTYDIQMFTNIEKTEAFNKHSSDKVPSALSPLPQADPICA